MIHPSRHRNAAPDDSPDLTLHTRLARGQLWTRRLWVASAVSCALSVVLWLAGVPVPWHLCVVGLGFMGGLLLPVRPATTWALEWIGKSGLSYQTALETRDTHDPYGFRAAVDKRAVQQLARLEYPQRQAWWLPFAVVAALLAVLPVVPFRSGLRLPSDTNWTTPSTASPERSPEPESEALSETTREDDDTSPPDSAEATPEAEDSSASTIEDFDDLGGGSPEANSDNVADEEALARFLDNLEQQPESEERPNPFRELSPQSRTDAESEHPQSERGETDQGEADSSQEGQQTPDEAGQTPGESQQESSESETGDQPGDQEGEQAGQEEGESLAGNDEGGDPQAASADESESGDENGLIEQGEGGDGAGELPGVGTETEGEELNAQSDPEQVRGRIQSGPSNLAGTVRLPGTVDGAQQGGGSGTSAFTQSEEQAITEGRIPVEYQEIIRNYFR